MRQKIMAWVTAVLVLLGVGLVMYPTVASWLSQYRQSLVIDNTQKAIEFVEPDREIQLQAAHDYNDALKSGALVKPGERKAIGTGTMVESGGKLWDYHDILNGGDDYGFIGRIKIPTAEVDLPVYHTSYDDVLLVGAGHLEGTSLPVGGEGTRAVITAHRGMANATMFTYLDRVQPGDLITLEVFGEVLVYQVFESKVVAPEDTESIRPDPERDLLTLVTCTPLGINTERILVTGERIFPTPQKAVDEAGKPSELPRFPWWIFVLLGAIVLDVLWLVWNYKGANRAERAAAERDKAAREDRDTAGQGSKSSDGGGSAGSGGDGGAVDGVAQFAPVRAKGKHAALPSRSELAAASGGALGAGILPPRSLFD